VKFSRESLLHTLESVLPGLARRGETVEQSSCLVFRGGKVHTYNDDIYCCATVEGMEDDFTGAVQAKKLTDLLGKLSDDEITLTGHDAELRLKAKGKQAGIRMEAEILIPLDNIDTPVDWLPLAEDFSDAVALVRDCASNDTNKFKLTCVNIHPEWVEACDGQQALRYRFDTGFAGSTLVKRDSIKFVVGLGMSEFCESDNWLHFRNGKGLQMSFRRYEEQDYPSEGLTNVFATKGTPVTLPKGIAEAVDKAKVFSEDNGDSDNVVVSLSGSNLVIYGQGVNGWYQEKRKVVWEGDDIEFSISPALLIEISKRYNDCEISEKTLKVDGGKWTYITSLNAVEAKPAKEGKEE
jgi:hypothetical protein